MKGVLIFTFSVIISFNGSSQIKEFSEVFKNENSICDGSKMTAYDSISKYYSNNFLGMKKSEIRDVFGIESVIRTKQYINCIQKYGRLRWKYVLWASCNQKNEYNNSTVVSLTIYFKKGKVVCVERY